MRLPLRRTPRARWSPPVRGLAGFWAVVAVVLLVGGSVLQWLGPPRHEPAAATIAQLPQATKPHAPTPKPALPASVAAQAVPAAPPGTIAPPATALLEAVPDDPLTVLPRIAPDGMSPMRAYAAAFDPHDHRPRIALLLAGIGLSTVDSEDAASQLPGAVSFAVSPYAAHPEAVLQAARAHGHEYLLSIPMEPQGFPLDEEGPQALLTGAPAEQNARRLDWALSRFAGYAGATGALDGLRGERFAAVSALLGGVERDLAARGLFYIDPRPGAGAPTQVAGRDVDLVIDQPAVGHEIEAKLAQLERIAHDRGAALGLAGMPTPVVIDRLAAWAHTLDARGFVLAPVSALVRPPPSIVSSQAAP